MNQCEDKNVLQTRILVKTIWKACERSEQRKAKRVPLRIQQTHLVKTHIQTHLVTHIKTHLVFGRGNFDTHKRGPWKKWTMWTSCWVPRIIFFNFWLNGLSIRVVFDVQLLHCWMRQSWNIIRVEWTQFHNVRQENVILLLCVFLNCHAQKVVLIHREFASTRVFSDKWSGFPNDKLQSSLAWSQVARDPSVAHNFPWKTCCMDLMGRENFVCQETSLWLLNNFGYFKNIRFHSIGKCWLFLESRVCPTRNFWTPSLVTLLIFRNVAPKTETLEHPKHLNTPNTQNTLSGISRAHQRTRIVPPILKLPQKICFCLSSFSFVFYLQSQRIQRPLVTEHNVQRTRSSKEDKDSGHYMWWRSRPKNLEKIQDIFERAAQTWTKFRVGWNPDILKKERGQKMARIQHGRHVCSLQFWRMTAQEKVW